MCLAPKTTQADQRVVCTFAFLSLQPGDWQWLFGVSRCMAGSWPMWDQDQVKISLGRNVTLVGPANPNPATLFTRFSRSNHASPSRNMNGRVHTQVVTSLFNLFLANSLWNPSRTTQKYDWFRVLSIEANCHRTCSWRGVAGILFA